MKPLLVLLAVFAVLLVTFKIFRGHYEFALSGRIAMSVMLLFTALGHFVFTKGMIMMLPSFVPYKTEVVHLTGILEIAGAIGLFLPNFRVITGWILMAFFLLILPANIYAAFNHIDYQNGTFEGNGPSYLWFRIPLQILFMVWTYLSAIKVY
ncbi:hypothetical protein D2V93_08570 [Flagellimonas taeanensis]|uniref:DoxX family protein n=1 Tax=Flavobacteriaceae TaxID=49546 RepID=UPI000E69B8DA|nr:MULTISPECIES: hypothetical protein [Allomuricauda]MDC6385809.1 hypothetical protein [Muricauda sp. SK9]RIV50914.1 hypothetical protein D2V93_08570 [Allomuricauda taeanensis]